MAIVVTVAVLGVVLLRRRRRKTALSLTDDIEGTVRRTSVRNRSNSTAASVAQGNEMLRSLRQKATSHNPAFEPAHEPRGSYLDFDESDDDAEAAPVLFNSTAEHNKRRQQSRGSSSKGQDTGAVTVATRVRRPSIDYCDPAPETPPRPSLRSNPYPGVTYAEPEGPSYLEPHGAGPIAPADYAMPAEPATSPLYEEAPAPAPDGAYDVPLPAEGEGAYDEQLPEGEGKYDADSATPAPYAAPLLPPQAMAGTTDALASEEYASLQREHASASPSYSSLDHDAAATTYALPQDSARQAPTAYSSLQRGEPALEYADVDDDTAAYPAAPTYAEGMPPTGSARQYYSRAPDERQPSRPELYPAVAVAPSEAPEVRLSRSTHGSGVVPSTRQAEEVLYDQKKPEWSAAAAQGAYYSSEQGQAASPELYAVPPEAQGSGLYSTAAEVAGNDGYLDVVAPNRSRLTTVEATEEVLHAEERGRGESLAI